MGAYLRLVTAGHADPGRVHVQRRSTSSRRTTSRAPTSSPTRRPPTPTAAPAGPEATFAIERMMDELAAELGMDPLELRAQELDHARGVPVHHRRRADLRLRQLRGRHRRRRWSCSATTSCGASRPSAASVERPGAARHRHLDVHRDVRPGPVAGARLAALRRRRLGARVDPDAADRQGRGGHRLVAARAGPRDGVEPDRRRPARRAVRGRRGPARRHPDLAKGLDTYGSRSLAVGGIAVVKAAEKVVAKAKPIAAHMLECAEDDLEFTDGPVPRDGHREGRHARRRRPRRRSPRTTCPTAWSPTWTPRPPTTRRTSPSRTARTCARRRSTPRPGRCRSARYVCVDDIGQVVNPLIVEGQVHGGLAQGIAQALYEEAVYDETGNLMTGTFVRLPGALARPICRASPPAAP